MATLKRTPFCRYAALLGLAAATSAFAADPAAPPPSSWAWWHDMPWPAFGWIFPLMCFAIMVVLLLFMLRGGLGCMGRGRSMHPPGSRDFITRSRSERAGSALDILNERYAAGQIDKREYEEKKAAMASST